MPVCGENVTTIELNEVSKLYPSSWRLQELYDALRDRLGGDIEALHDISASIERGEPVCLIGRNGSGKSTFLKLVAGIATQSSGCISVHGRIMSVLEIGTGLNPHMSGRANIFSVLPLHGFDKKEVAELVPRIIAFSELGNDIDRPVRTYSTGMAARLAFSLAVVPPSDVLLLDELIVVGDEYFQGKCTKHLRGKIKRGEAIVLASHSIPLSMRLAKKMIWLQHGKLREQGEVFHVSLKYHQSAFQDTMTPPSKDNVKINSVDVDAIEEDIRISIKVDRKMSLPDCHLALSVHDMDAGEVCVWFRSSLADAPVPVGVGPMSCNVRFKRPNGLRRGMLGVALIREQKPFEGSEIEDEIGWNTGDSVFFDFDRTAETDSSTYFDAGIKWSVAQ